ncbi:MAG: PAS domain S-box protein, partial [Bacteroidales bacterium]|nr:PAS domain S-box protein [Bacteroidales bacterium]
DEVPTMYEVELQRKDGSKLYAELNAGVTLYEGKSADFVIIRDITERKQVEENLLKKEEHHRAVIENIFKFVPEGLLVFTKNLNLMKQNKAFEEIVRKYADRLGYTEEELAEKIVEQLRGRIPAGDTTEIHIPEKEQRENA